MEKSAPQPVVILYHMLHMPKFEDFPHDPTFSTVCDVLVQNVTFFSEFLGENSQ
jgi:hypothetical protein